MKTKTVNSLCSDPATTLRCSFDRATTAFRWMRDHYLVLTGISGFILIVMGVLLLTNEYSWLNARAQDGLNALHLDFFKSL